MDRDETPFAGENRKNNKLLGVQSLVTVDLFKRQNETFFMRVSLRSDVDPRLISRYELDVDKHISEADFLHHVEVAGGALAERQNKLHGDRHEPSDCARTAREAAYELLRGI